MKTAFYPKLAWSGIRKNRRLYLPYFLTCAGMATMFFLIAFLSVDPLLKEIRGGTALGSILSFAKFVIAIFALIFLFYTNSFLMRRRKKEFGLYNILGMSKRNLARILVCESLLLYVSSVTVGIVLGIVLSKLAELGLMNVLQMEIRRGFTFSWTPVWHTLLTFGAIFIPLFLSSLWQLWRTNSLQLLHSESLGEKPPRSNWLLALLGALLLGGAYWLAVSIEQPLDALAWFFVAVVMVILATYLLLIAGSVVFCRLLQKNKRYYYAPNHFVSVSSMVYRMKRNGAGLASICILVTMVLVMISSTVSLYVGAEDSIQSYYPFDFAIQAALERPDDVSEEVRRDYRAKILDLYRDAEPKNVVSYRLTNLSISRDGAGFGVPGRNGDTVTLDLLPLEDYNEITGTNVELGEGEALTSANYGEKTIRIANLPEMRVVGTTETIPEIYNDHAFFSSRQRVFVVVRDYDDVAGKLWDSFNSDIEGERLAYGCMSMKSFWLMGFDYGKAFPGDDELAPMREDSARPEFAGRGYGLYSRAEAFRDFISTYGALFFIGIVLSIVFISAAVLIIYYKQISEGYEDQARFDIMQKVGMTKREIRKSVNVQVLLVFFIPLLLAGLHLAFAFPLVWKILQLFSLENLPLLIWVTVGCYLVFALLYALVYRLTSNVYYKIVSGKAER